MTVVEAQQKSQQTRESRRPWWESVPGLVPNLEPRISTPPIPTPQQQREEQTRQQVTPGQAPTIPTQVQQPQLQPSQPPQVTNPQAREPLADRELVREFEVDGRKFRVYFVVPRVTGARTGLERFGDFLTNLSADFDSQVSLYGYGYRDSFSSYLMMRTRRPNIYSNDDRRRDLADNLADVIRNHYDVSSLARNQTYEIYIHGFSGSPRGNLNTVDSIYSNQLVVTSGNSTIQLQFKRNRDERQMNDLRREAQILIDSEVKEVQRDLRIGSYGRRTDIGYEQSIRTSNLIYPDTSRDERREQPVDSALGMRRTERELDLNYGSSQGIRFAQRDVTNYDNFGIHNNRTVKPGENIVSETDASYARYGNSDSIHARRENTERTYRGKYDYLAFDPLEFSRRLGSSNLSRGTSLQLPFTRYGSGFSEATGSFSPTLYREQLNSRLDLIRGGVADAIVRVYETRMNIRYDDASRAQEVQRIRNMLDDATLIRLLSGNNDYMSRGFGPFFGQINEEELYRLMPELRTSNVSGRDIERAFTQGNLRTLARDYSNFFYDGQRRLRGEVLGTTGYMVDIRTRRDKSISDGKEKVKEMKSAELFYHRDVDTGLRRATGRYYEDGRFQEYSAAYSFGRRYEVGGGYIQDEDNKTGVLYGVDKTKLGTDKKGIHPYLVGAITRDVKVAGERSSTALGIVGAKINLGNPTSLGSFYGTAIAGFGSNNDYLIAYRADYGSAYGSGYGSNGLVRSAAIYQFGGGKERGDSLHLAATESKETINKDRGEYSRRERSYEAWTESYRNPEVSYRQTGIGYMQRDDKRTDKSTTSTDVYARAYDTRVGSQSTTTLSLGYFRSSRDNKPTVKTEREYTMSEQKGNFLHIHGSTTLSKGSSQTTGVTISTGKSEMTTVYDKQGSYSMRTDPQRITVSTVTDGKNLATGANVEFRLGKKVHTDGKGGTTTSVDYVGGTYYSYGNNQKPTGMVTYTREEQRVGGYTRAHVSLGNLYGQGYYEAGFMYGRSGRNVDSQIGLLLSSRGISVSYGVRW